jgi:hypothetical protein
VVAVVVRVGVQETAPVVLVAAVLVFSMALAGPVLLTLAAAVVVVVVIRLVARAVPVWLSSDTRTQSR